MNPLLPALCLLAATALGALALAGGPGPGPTGAEDYVYALGGVVHAQARYFDGLASTKVAFLMLQGQGGAADDRLSPGARCTEWHGTFTLVSLKAGAEDNSHAAVLELSGFAAAVPPTADGQRAGPGWTVDVMGGPGAWDGVLLVCDHPDGDGAADFTGTVADMPFTHAPYAGLVHLQEA